MPHEGQYEPGQRSWRGASGSEATIFDPRRDKGSVGAGLCVSGARAPAVPPRLKGSSRARNIKRGLSCSREWRILCRFLVDRAPDSIAIGSASGTGLIKIVGAPQRLFLLLFLSFSSKPFLCHCPLSTLFFGIFLVRRECITSSRFLYISLLRLFFFFFFLSTSLLLILVPCTTVAAPAAGNRTSLHKILRFLAVAAWEAPLT